MTKFRIQYQEDDRTGVVTVYAPDEMTTRRKMRKIIGHQGFLINNVKSEIFPGAGVWV